MLTKFLECFFRWNVQLCAVRVERKTVDVLIGQSFGGNSNAIMADIALRIRTDYRLPMILQREITDPLPRGIINLFVISKHRQKGDYLDTFEVLSQTERIMTTNGWSKALVLCHPWHAWRIAMVLKKMGIKAVFPLEIRNIPFDPNSAQWWTRNKFLWILREIPARLIYLAKGWI